MMLLLLVCSQFDLVDCLPPSLHQSHILLLELELPLGLEPIASTKSLHSLLVELLYSVVAHLKSSHPPSVFNLALVN